MQPVCPLYQHEGDFVRFKRLGPDSGGRPNRDPAVSPVPPSATTVVEPGISAFVTHDRIVAWVQSYAQGRLP